MAKITMLLSNPYRPDPRVQKEAIYLASLGHDVEVFALDYRNERRDVPVETKDGFTVRRFHTSPAFVDGTAENREFVTKVLYRIPFFWHFESFRHLLRFRREAQVFLQENPTDYLHGHDLSGAWVGLYLRDSQPLVFDMHEDYETPTKLKAKFRLFIRAFVHHIQNRCQCIVCAHQPQIDAVSAQNRHKVLSLPNYPYTASMQQMERTRSERLRLVYSGSILLETVALHVNFFEAAKELPIDIIIHGDGIGYEQLKAAAAPYEHVTLTGHYDHRHAFDSIYSHADISYMLYDYHSIGSTWPIATKLYETLCADTPFIVHEHTVMGEYAEENGVGFAVDTYSVESIRLCLKNLIEDPLLVRGMQESIRERDYKRTFSWEDAVTVLKVFYGAV